jgi:hypothetical protein
LKAMVPMSPYEACSMGLVDQVLPGHGALLDQRIRRQVKELVTGGQPLGGSWKSNVDLSPAGLAMARTKELGEMARDFWSPRSTRYSVRRRDFVRKVKPVRTPLRFASHRRVLGMLDEEEKDDFESVQLYAQRALEKHVKPTVVAVASKLETKSSVIETKELVLPATPPNETSHVDAADEKRDVEPIFSCYFNGATEDAAKEVPVLTV